MKENRCSSPNLSGYWKGSLCCSPGKFTHTDGKCYCGTHLAVIQNDPARIDKVKAQWEKYQKKLGKPITWAATFG